MRVDVCRCLFEGVFEVVCACVSEGFCVRRCACECV